MKIDFFQNVISFLDINQFKNIKSIVLITIISYLLFVLLRHYKLIKNSEINQLGLEDLKKISELNKLINEIKLAILNKKQGLADCNRLIGKKATDIIIELDRVFIEHEYDMSLIDAITNTESYEKAKEKNNNYSFYRLIEPILFSNQEDYSGKKELQYYLGIREHIGKNYIRGKVPVDKAALLGEDNKVLVENISKKIIDYYSDTKKTSERYENCLFYGPPGTGKTLLIENIIFGIVEEIPVLEFKINKADIQGVNDIQSLKEK